MADSTDTQNTVTNLSENLRNIPKDLRIFSTGLRMLFAEIAVSSQSESETQINELRDSMKKDAMVYSKKILPLCTYFVRLISNFFDYYEHLDYKEWLESLSNIITEVKGYQECCSVLIELHKSLMIPLKKREDEARVILSELDHVTKEYKQVKEFCERTAGIGHQWACALLLHESSIPVAVPYLLIGAAEISMAVAAAKDRQCSINEAALVLVRDTLIPALSQFIDGVGRTAGFFSAMQQQLITFQAKADRAESTRDADCENNPENHYKIMKKMASRIHEDCKGFHAIIPQVETDLLAIRDTSTHRNYVDEWLDKRIEEIRIQYELDTTTPQLNKMLTCISSSD